MRFRLVCTTLLAVPLVTALAARPSNSRRPRSSRSLPRPAGRSRVSRLKISSCGRTRPRARSSRRSASAEPLFITLLVDTTPPPMGVPWRPVPPTQDLRRGAVVVCLDRSRAGARTRRSRSWNSPARRSRPSTSPPSADARPVHPAPVSQPAERCRADRSDGRGGQEAQRQALPTPRDRVDRLQLARHERRKDDEAGGGEHPQGRRHRVAVSIRGTVQLVQQRARKC